MIWRDKFNTYSELIIICYVPLSISNNFWREIKNRIFFFPRWKIYLERIVWMNFANQQRYEWFILFIEANIAQIANYDLISNICLLKVAWEQLENLRYVIDRYISIPLAEKDLRQEVDRWTLINHRKEILLEDMENRELNRYFLNLKILKAWNLFPSKSSLDHKEIETLATRWTI